jgi:hypothetical protein
MAWQRSFVNTFKRDYIGGMDRSNGAVVLAQLPDASRPPLKRKPRVEKFQPHPEVWRLAPKVEDIEINGRFKQDCRCPSNVTVCSPYFV